MSRIRAENGRAVSPFVRHLAGHAVDLPDDLASGAGAHGGQSCMLGYAVGRNVEGQGLMLAALPAALAHPQFDVRIYMLES
jgi:RimJ/RimL family protein N-acetyltransferase